MIFYRQALLLTGVCGFLGVVGSVYWALGTGSVMLIIFSIYIGARRKHPYELNYRDINRLLGGKKVTLEAGLDNEVVITLHGNVNALLHGRYMRMN